MILVGNCSFGELFLAYQFGIWPESTDTSSSDANATASVVSNANANFTYCNTDPGTQLVILGYGQTAYYAAQVILQVG